MESKTNDTDENILFKSKRDQFASEIRKKHTENILNAKRMKFTMNKDNITNPTFNNTISEAERFKFLANNFQMAMQEKNIPKLEAALTEIRLALSQGENSNSHVGLLYETQTVPLIIGFLRKEHFGYTKVQSEAAWIIANVLSAETEYTEDIVKNLNGIEVMMELLQAPSSEVQENAIWALANIAGDSRPNAKILLEKGIVKYITKGIENNLSSPEILQNFAWLLSNLSKGKPFPDFSLLAPTLPSLEELMRSTDIDTVYYVLCTVEHLTTGADEETIDTIMEMDCIQDFISFAMADEENLSQLRLPALKLLGNCLTGYDSVATRLINMDIIPCLMKNVNSKVKKWRKEALWAISNLIICGSEIIEVLFKVPNFLERLTELVLTDAIDVRSEALTCLMRAAEESSYRQLDLMIEKDLIRLALEVLSLRTNTSMMVDALKTLEIILRTGQDIVETEGGFNPYLVRLDKEGGLAIIENMQGYLDEQVQKKATEIIDEFFALNK